MRASPWTLSALVLSATAGAATLPFEEGFEAGNTAAWVSSSPSPQNTLSVVDAAAKEGQYGLRLTDGDSSSGAKSQNHLALGLTSAGASLYGAVWIRWAAAAGSGSMRLFRVQSAAGAPMLAVDVMSPTGALRMPHASASGWETLDGSGAVTPSTWHLLEFALTGMGTVSGAARVWLDGRPVANSGVLNWSAAEWRAQGFDLGEPWSTGAVTGRVDYDELRLDGAPFPSTFAWKATSPQPFPGDCATFELSVVSSFSAAAVSAGRPRTAALSAPPGSAFFSGPGCTAPIASVSFAASDSVRAVAFKASVPGVHPLSAAAPSLVPGALAFSVNGPIAQVTPESQTVAAGETATLDASASTPSSGSALTEFRWRAVGGATGVTLPTDPSQKLSLRVPGRYLFEVRVTDATGRTSEPARTELIVTGEVAAPSGELPGCAAGGSSSGALAAAMALLSLALRRRRDRP